MPQTWVLYSIVPFKLIGCSVVQLEVERVANLHVKTIKRILTERGIEVTPYTIALAWNGGPDRLIYLPRHIDYAIRVEQLYNSHQSSK
jgi:hypothetical protein